MSGNTFRLNASVTSTVPTMLILMEITRNLRAPQSIAMHELNCEMNDGSQISKTIGLERNKPVNNGCSKIRCWVF